LPSHIGMSVLQMPGRDHRYNEPFEKDLRGMAKKIALTIYEYEGRGKQFFFFGHSLGALIAFEVARVLETHEGYAPTALFLSARRAAHITSPVKYHTWSDEELLLMLREMAGTNQEFFENDALRSIFLPIIRSDFRLLESYSHNEDEKIDVDIVAMAGRADVLAPPEEVKEWRKNTGGIFTYKEYEGDHFFINNNKEKILKNIGETIGFYINNNRVLCC